MGYFEKIQNEKFFTTFGFEFTYIPKDIDYQELLSIAYSKLIEFDFKKKIYKCKPENENKKIPNCFKVIDDEFAIEINSPVFHNFQEVKTFYENMENIVKKYPLVAKHSKICGGGGHIHAGCSNFSLEEKFNIFCEIHNRPYLNWIFNEWADDISSEPLFDTNLFKHYLIKKDIFASKYDYNIWKGNSIIESLDTETIEFRFFDAQSNFDEVIDHLLFINRLLIRNKKISDDKYISPIIFKHPRDALKMIKGDKCINEFFDLLNQLQLPKKRYEKYIEMNYKKRKEAGCWFKEKYMKKMND